MVLKGKKRPASKKRKAPKKKKKTNGDEGRKKE